MDAGRLKPPGASTEAPRRPWFHPRHPFPVHPVPSKPPPPPPQITPLAVPPQHHQRRSDHPRVCPRAAAQMPICIECRHPVNTLWTQYSGAGDKSTGHNIRLTVCRKCGRFCDKYVEHDFVVLFIDLVLIKPQVCNRRRCRRQSDALPASDPVAAADRGSVSGGPVESTD